MIMKKKLKPFEPARKRTGAESGPKKKLMKKSTQKGGLETVGVRLHGYSFVDCDMVSYSWPVFIFAYTYTGRPLIFQIAAKYPYQKPAKGDEAAEFSQYYMARNVRSNIIYTCGECSDLALEWDQTIKYKGRSCLVLPLCRSCIFANRRISQNIFFNITVKNAHDAIIADDRADHREGEAEEDKDSGIGEDVGNLSDDEESLNGDN